MEKTTEKTTEKFEQALREIAAFSGKGLSAPDIVNRLRNIAKNALK